jgi:hypothetical protein
MTTERKPHGYYTDKLFTPADMEKAIAAEREACAKACESMIPFGPEIAWQKATMEDCAAEIRARGNT